MCSSFPALCSSGLSLASSNSLFCSETLLLPPCPLVRHSRPNNLALITEPVPSGYDLIISSQPSLHPPRPCRENPAGALHRRAQVRTGVGKLNRTRSVHLDAPGQRRGQRPVSGTADPGVVKQDKSSGGSVDTTGRSSDPQRVGLFSGERPVGAAKGKQLSTKASCQHPPPPPPPLLQPTTPSIWTISTVAHLDLDGKRISPLSPSPPPPRNGSLQGQRVNESNLRSLTQDRGNTVHCVRTQCPRSAKF